MANLKAIRTRISTVKSTQKITRAMKMVAGARLNRAQQRIVALRPYAERMSQVLAKAVASEAEGGGEVHPLLRRRPEKACIILLLTSDRGLCGAFNSSLNKYTHALIREKKAAGIDVRLATVGRRGRDYFVPRQAAFHEKFMGVWDELDLAQAQRIARSLLSPFVKGEVDSIYVVYNEFKSAMTQRVTCLPLLPLALSAEPDALAASPATPSAEYIFEPDRQVLFEHLVPMYIETTLLRTLFDSVASELGARMTAMDSATKNAQDMISQLTLQYNRQRQAVITTELTEIIGGAEALQA